MSDSVVFPRRDFLKLVGLGVAGAASGCAQPPADKLLPYLVAPTDILIGVPYWYPSTCTECPAGCGIRVKAREGRAIKIEGDPASPVSRGGLCARGQAGLQGLYDPDRLKTPMLKKDGVWKEIAWDEALQLAGGKLAEARGGKRGVALLTGHVTGTFAALAKEIAAAPGGRHLAWEPFGHESLREANRRTFGLATVPHYDFAAAKMILSFGADFLETWMNPTGHARDFAEARRAGQQGMAHFVTVEPRLSLTGANADEWVAVKPGSEMALALGLAREILIEGHGPAVAERAALLDALSAWTPDAVAAATEVGAEEIRHMAKHFAKAAPSLAVAGGIASQSEQSVALAAAVNLLNHVAGNVGRTVRFDRTPSFEGLGGFADLQKLVADMGEGRIDVAIVHRANPVYSAPAWAGFVQGFNKVAFKVALATSFDETAYACDLVLPVQHPLETVDDAEPARGVHALLQPTMKPIPLFDARPAGDALMALGRAAGMGERWPETYAELVKARWQPLHQRHGAGRDFEGFWLDAVKQGGVVEEVSSPAVRWTGTPTFAAPSLSGGGELALVLYPTVNLYDGRGANKPWLQELPDVTTKAVWGSWAEIHPETAAALGIAQGDPLRVETEAGAVELPAYLYAGLRKDVVAIPLGQGHTAYGRYANGRGLNALSLLSPAQDAASGAVAYLSARAKLSKGAAAMDLVVSQHVKEQEWRRIAQVVPLAALMADGKGSTHEPPKANGVTDPHGEAHAKDPGTLHPDSQHADGGAGHHAHKIFPRSDVPGIHTEPRVVVPGEKTPAHAITAYEPEEQARHPRQVPVSEGMYKRAEHRWAMAIDLHACTGCSACVVACSAENNIPVVGPEIMKRGREMTWIRIERYEHGLGEGMGADVRHVPMMCQHCGDAPCEMVCPVYATYHNPEGLNAMVYNRCVGTRYCSNNCPYKVRAFNFWDYAAPEKPTFSFPEPLNWQLNPDVTVRSKGVMEKCTMCVQRILEAKGNAKDDERKVADGEFTTACAQSCPTEAIVFGDLVDPESKVSKLSRGDRRYWVFNELNTKPGVTYLKKVSWSSGEGHAG
jgi:molybdopterin-containing oxidoreductase family iron-sulfur binding subunit